MTDSELVEFTASFRAGILNGRESWMKCFMVCAPLVTLLNMNGADATMVESAVVVDDGVEINHFWLSLGDGRVLDPTADQFNHIFPDKMPPVYLGPPTLLHERAA